MLMHRGWSHYVDQLRDDLWQHHPEIHIVDFDFYSMDGFNRCENSNLLLSVRRFIFHLRQEARSPLWTACFSVLWEQTRP